MKAYLAEVASNFLMFVSRRTVSVASPWILNSPEVPEELKK